MNILKAAFLPILFTILSQSCFNSISTKKINPFLKQEPRSKLGKYSYPDDKSLEKDAYLLRIYLSDKFDIFSQEKFANQYKQTIYIQNKFCNSDKLNVLKIVCAVASASFLCKNFIGKNASKKKIHLKKILRSSLLISPAILHLTLNIITQFQIKKFMGNVLLFKSFFDEANFFKNRKLLKKQKNFFPPIKITTALFKEGYCLVDKEDQTKVYTCKDLGEDLINLFNQIYILDIAVNEPQINSLIEQFLKDREVGTKLLFLEPTN